VAASLYIRLAGISKAVLEEDMITIKDTDIGATSNIAFVVQYVDAKGQPALVDGTPVWAVSNSTAASAPVVAADGMSATVPLTGNVGNFQVSVTADADLGAGVKSLVSTEDVQVVAGEAVAGNLSGTFNA